MKLRIYKYVQNIFKAVFTLSESSAEGRAKAYFYPYLYPAGVPMKITEIVESYEEEMVDAMKEMLKIEAISPESGGKGELKRAEFLQKWISDFGFDEIERYDAKDVRAEGGIRPNMVATIHGKNRDQRIWIISHMDTVPVGDISKWKTGPFEPVVKEGKIYGRGAEDNGQSLIASMYAAKAIIDSGEAPDYDFSIVFVSDEETGSKYGIQHLVNLGLFRKDDIVIVPDHGVPQGNEIEIAEKSIYWVKVTTYGKQTHSSIPNTGINALRAGAKYLVEVDRALHERFSEKDKLFTVPVSTFEPTKKEENQPNINAVPGEDVFYFDMRLIPTHNITDIMVVMNEVAEKVSKETGTKISPEVYRGEPAPPATPADSEVVIRLKNAIEKVRGIEPKLVGIGGGTCAAYIRYKGIPAAVWSTIDETMHQANEYCKIENLVSDARVFSMIGFHGHS